MMRQTDQPVAQQMPPISADAVRLALEAEAHDAMLDRVADRCVELLRSLSALIRVAR